MRNLAAFFVIITLAACDGPKGPAPVFHFGLKPDSTAGGVIISPDDTLWNISQRYRLPLRDIIDLNGLKPPYALASGQRLKLPPPVDYTVGDRDTLRSVAYMFDVPVSKLAQVNGLNAPYALRPGMVLRIPSSLRQERTEDERAPAPAAQKKTVLLKSPKVERRPLPELLMPSRPPRAEETATTLPPSARRGFSWPVKGKVVSKYGAKAGGLFNDGVNIAAPRGARVGAAADGTVVYAGNALQSYGNLVLVRHKGGITTAYAHLASMNVKRGDVVKAGQAVGTVGSTGAARGAQLHFEVRRGRETVDPMGWL